MVGNYTPKLQRGKKHKFSSISKQRKINLVQMEKQHMTSKFQLLKAKNFQKYSVDH